MSFQILGRRVANSAMAIIYTAVIALAALVLPASMVSAETSSLPEPVSPGASCEWMGEMHYEVKDSSTYISTGYNRDYETTMRYDTVTAPVEGQACGALWSSSTNLIVHEYEPAYCTTDTDDTNTRNSTQNANGYGNGTFAARLVASSSFPGKYYILATETPVTTNGSIVYEYINNLCGGSGSNTYDFGAGSLGTTFYCITSPSATQYEMDGFFIKPTSQASVGTCTRTVGSSEAAGSFSQTEKFEWRFRKVNCNPSIDSDGGGTSDCQEYEDKTNPMKASDDIQSDKIAPTITLNTPLNGNSVLLGSSATASFSCQDEAGGSGIDSCQSTIANGSALDTSTVGTKSFTITATDKAGNTEVKTATYTVIYQSSGFLGPVDANTVNKAKAGQTVPVQFRLLDGGGNPIASSSSFKSLTSSASACTTGVATDEIEQYSTGNSGLQYLGGGLWQYNWKTEKSYAGQCRIIYLNLADGSKASAKFQF